MTRVLDLPLGTPWRVRRAWRALHSFRCLRELRAAYGMQQDGALTDEARTALIRARDEVELAAIEHGIRLKGYNW